MFLANKKMGTGIVFALLWSTMLAAALPSFAAGPELSEEALAVVRQNDVKKMQQALFDRGCYRGKVDGVMGLHTRESIRAFQKAEKLPGTGRLDPQTASKLGVNPESNRRSSRGTERDTAEGKDRPGNQAAKGKPWAGTRMVIGTRRAHGTLPKLAPTGVDHDGASKSGREDGLRAENQKRPQ